MKIKMLLLYIVLLVNQFGYSQNTLMTGMDKPKWEKVKPGVWKASLGEMGLIPFDYANLLKESAPKELDDTPFLLDRDATLSLLTNERAVVRIPFEEKENTYEL